MRSASPSGTHFNDSIAKHMRPVQARLHIGQTIGSAIDEMRKNQPEGRLVYFYVVDDNNKLCGVVQTRRLLFDPPETTIEEVMVRRIVYINENATVYDACEFFVLHRLLAIPVVNEHKQLVGVVDVEVYSDELTNEGEETHDDLFQLIGVHLRDAKPLSPFVAFKKRFPWLLANVLGGLVAAVIAGFFEQEVQRVVALAMFIPVVLALAESVCIQSVSITLEMLHAQKPSVSTIARTTKKEFATGLILGIVSGGIISVVSYLWLGQASVATALVVGITTGVSVAAMIGVAVPNFLKLFHFEPQVATGPLALAATDVIALLAYFGMAKLLIS